MGGNSVSGPWDSVISLVAEAVDQGAINLEGAAALNIALGRTHGADAPATCGVCDCPIPGMAHASGQCIDCWVPL